MIDLSPWRARAVTLAIGVSLVWAISLFGIFVDRGVVFDLALVPRRAGGLPGILGMPFVHDSLGHLLANTMPLAMLGGMLVARGVGYFLTVSLAIALLGGLALWGMGREAAHVGASGLVFGFFGFLLTRGFYERSIRAVAAALAVSLLYGGMVFGVLPRSDQVSWEAHLFGLIAGVIAARGAFAIDQRRQQAEPEADDAHGLSNGRHRS